MTDISRADAGMLAVCYEGFLHARDDNAACVWAGMLIDLQTRLDIVLVQPGLLDTVRSEALARLRRAEEIAANPAPHIAERFVAILREWITDEDWNEMLARNYAETDPRICHSHDYCDANMAMVDAFQAVLGREPDVGTEADAAICNAAWDIALPHLTEAPGERN